MVSGVLEHECISLFIMNKSRKFVTIALAIVVLLVAAHQRVSAQTFTIAEPNIVACGGLLYDSGGSSGGGYGVGEDFTTTICPNQPGDFISLNFLLFNLSQSGMAPVDGLSIYDGDLVSAPLIGTYTGQQLQGLVIVASQFNSAGCLTLRFRSNEVGSGNFAISIGCGQPCAAPSAVLNTQQGTTVTMCQGQELVLDGSSSFAMPDREIIKRIWRRSGASVDTTLTPEFNFSTAQGGVNSITLQVMDDQGCPSNVSAPVHALVSSAPSISLSASSYLVCPGASVDLTGQAEATPMVSASAGCQPLGNGLALPDDLGIPFTSTVPLGSAMPGSILTDIGQLGDICMEMEHSFIGDLVLTLTCPSGQSVVLHQQGGGGANLGVPGPLMEQGVCWTYCFSATPEYGTWASSAAGASSTLPSGTYASVEPLEQLLGCPLNGTWTLTVLDLWASDDGYLCGWCLDSADPPDSSFIALGPIPGSSPDSSFWSGAGVDNDPVSGGAASALTPDPGSQLFTYSVIDSYGCQYDTSLTIQVSAALSVNMGPDIVLCSGPEVIGAQVLEGFVPQACTYTLRLFDSAGNGWSSLLFGDPAYVYIVLDGQSTTYTLNSGALGEFSIAVTPGAALSVQYLTGDVNAQNSFDLLDDQGAVVYASPTDPVSGEHYSGAVSCNGGVSATEFSWSPENGLSDPTVLTPAVFTLSSGWYVLTASVADEPLCFVVDSVWVEALDSGILTISWDAEEATLCTDPGFEEYDWYRENVLELTTSTPCIEEVQFGLWHVIATPALGCAWGSLDTLLCPVISIVQDGGLLLTDPGLGTYSWTFQGSEVEGVVGPFLEILGGGNYAVTVTTEYGCVINASIVVVGSVGLELDPTTGPVWSVYPVPNDGQFIVEAAGLTGTMAQVRILDLSGRSIHERQEPVSSGRMRSAVLLHAAPGTYMVQVIDGARSLVQRIVLR
jgi:hypothetical protein